MKIIILTIFYILSTNLEAFENQEYSSDIEPSQMSHYEKEILYKKSVSLLYKSINEEIDVDKIDWSKELEEVERSSENYNAFSDE